MNKNKFERNISLKCFFCSSEMFVLPSEDYIPFYGSFVVCANCGRENDFTSLIYVAEKKAHDMVEEYIEDALESLSKDLKKTFRNTKHIKIR